MNKEIPIKDMEYFLNEIYNLILSPNIFETEREKLVAFKNDASHNDPEALKKLQRSLLPSAAQGKLSPEVKRLYHEIYKSQAKQTGYTNLGGIGGVIRGI